MVYKEKQVNVNFNLNQINYNQHIKNKIKNKLHMEAINHTSFKLEEKAISSIKNRDESERFSFLIKLGGWVRGLFKPPSWAALPLKD